MRQLVSRLICLGIIIWGLSLNGELMAFVDMINFLIVITPVFFLLFAKYGLKGITFFKIDDISLQSQIARDGGLLCLLMGLLAALIGFVVMLGTLSNQAALGPSMAVCLIAPLYSLFLYLFIFLPFEQRGADD